MKPKDIGGSSTHSETEKLLELERLIVRLSRDFAGAPVEKIDAKIDEALKLIVECLGIDRCAFWEITENFNDVVISHSYIVPQVDGQFSKVNPQDFPWILAKSMNGEHVCFGSIDELPEEAASDRKTFQALGIKSFLALPYYIGGYPVAGLTFDSKRREISCSDEIVVRLKLLGEIITGAFHRKKLEDKYRRKIVEAQLAKDAVRSEDFPLSSETRSECIYEGIIGNSAAMRQVFSRMEQVAPTDSVVLILGETGTGKGVVARAIHDLSRRKDKRFVMVNCAALTPNLIESELFGREKGAYTGSTEMQIGRFELADKGTLILDEITELPLDLQAKLLRAIQDGEFERLGSPRTIKVDVRIIALTSRDLKEEVARGRFRQDLYYRLNVFPILMPPLRERTGDIPFLTAYFLNNFSRKMQKDIRGVPKDVMAQLMTYSWPGNVRELEHVIERAVIISRGPTLQLAEKLAESGTVQSDENNITNLAEVEKRHIIKILNSTNWRIEGPRGAAMLLGLHPNTLRGRMQKLGIQPKKGPSEP